MDNINVSEKSTASIFLVEQFGIFPQIKNFGARETAIASERL
jgi:hypothetical protein